MFNFAPAFPARSDVDWCWYLRRQGKPGEMLERKLHDIGVLDPGGWAVWGPSPLTSTGSPVEITFRAGQSRLQLVTEIANPSGAKDDRVNEVCRQIAGLGGIQPSAALREVIGVAQSNAQLGYGARLGLRYGKAKIHGQLFAELPADARDLSALITGTSFATILDSVGDLAQPAMFSHDGESGAQTMHFVLKNPTQECLGHLAKPAKVAPEILTIALTGLFGLGTGKELPALPLHFSYRSRGNGKPPMISLGYSARTLFKSDAAVTRRVKSVGGFETAGYCALVDNLPPAAVSTTHHGLLGVTATTGAAPVPWVNVAAPWAYLEEADIV